MSNNSNIEKENQELKEKLAAADKDLKEAMALNAELQKKAEEATAAGKGNRPTVKIGSQLYELLYPSISLPSDEGGKPAKTYSAKELIADKGLCKKLIESGSKIFREVK